MYGTKYKCDVNKNLWFGCSVKYPS